MPRSMFTLFQFAVGFEPDICRATWADGVAGYIFTAFLILYTLLSGLVILNIMASIIVEVVMSISAKQQKEEEATQKEQDLKEVEEKVDNLFRTLDISRDQDLDYRRLNCAGRKSVGKVFRSAGLVPSDAKEIFEILDMDLTGTVSPDECREGLLRLKRPPDPKDLLRIECNLCSLERKVDRFMGMHEEVMTALRHIDSSP